MIDDENDIYDMVALSLRNQYVVDYAPDGFVAQKLIGQKHYDTILCDICMPFLDGLVLIEEFQKKQINIPFIFVSGMINDEVRKRACQLGASHIVGKPFKIKDLANKIELAVSSHAEGLQSFIDEESLKKNQNQGYIFDRLKFHYYQFGKILSDIHYHQIPIELVLAELEKKEQTGKCLFDHSDYIRLLTTIAPAA